MNKSHKSQRNRDNESKNHYKGSFANRTKPAKGHREKKNYLVRTRNHLDRPQAAFMPSYANAIQYCTTFIVSMINRPYRIIRTALQVVCTRSLNHIVDEAVASRTNQIKNMNVYDSITGKTYKTKHFQNCFVSVSFDCEDCCTEIVILATVRMAFM